MMGFSPNREYVNKLKKENKELIDAQGRPLDPFSGKPTRIIDPFEGAKPCIPGIKETFNWLVPEILDAIPIGQNQVRVKVRAVKSDDISMNGRKYVEEELIQGARTWVGRPILVNHNPNIKIGDIGYSAYENGNLELLLNVNKGRYANMIREKHPAFKGWSIGASYFFMKCPKCGERATDIEVLKSHLREAHGIVNAVYEPRGMVGTEISFVEDPELPGLKTESELMETTQGWQKLCETIVQEHTEPVGLTGSGSTIHIGKAGMGKRKEQPELEAAPTPKPTETPKTDEEKILEAHNLLSSLEEPYKQAYDTVVHYANQNTDTLRKEQKRIEALPQFILSKENEDLREQNEKLTEQVNAFNKQLQPGITETQNIQSKLKETEDKLLEETKRADAAENKLRYIRGNFKAKAVMQPTNVDSVKNPLG